MSKRQQAIHEREQNMPEYARWIKHTYYPDGHCEVNEGQFEVRSHPRGFEHGWYKGMSIACFDAKVRDYFDLLPNAEFLKQRTFSHENVRQLSKVLGSEGAINAMLHRRTGKTTELKLKALWRLATGATVYVKCSTSMQTRALHKEIGDMALAINIPTEHLYLPGQKRGEMTVVSIVDMDGEEPIEHCTKFCPNQPT